TAEAVPLINLEPWVRRRGIRPSSAPVNDRASSSSATMTTTDAPSENRIISIRTSRFENFAKLSVSDLGPGIPEDKLKEVFEPFFTSKAEGMGMGLSIARTIVEAHNGQIWAENRDHGGATFRIRLPLVQ